MAIIRLSEVDLSFADLVGRWRQDENVANGLKRGGAFIKEKANTYWQDVLGVRGEIAFARFLGIQFIPTKMSEVDVGGYEVRTVDKPLNRLIIRPRDVAKGSPFVLMVMVERELYRPAGWIGAKEGSEVGSWENPETGKDAGFAWFVSQSHLKPFSRKLEWGDR